MLADLCIRCKASHSPSSLLLFYKREKSHPLPKAGETAPFRGLSPYDTPQSLSPSSLKESDL